MQFRPAEAFFATLILYFGLYFAAHFFAVLTAIIFSSLALGALLLSGLAELIERSKVPRYYFGYLGAVLLAGVGFLVVVFTYADFRWDDLAS